MKNNDGWSLGRGIGYGLKYISIMGMIIALLSFAQFLIKFNAGYYENERPDVCKLEPEIVRACEGIDPYNQDQCCELQYGKGYVWDDGCVFRGET